MAIIKRSAPKTQKPAPKPAPKPAAKAPETKKPDAARVDKADDAKKPAESRKPDEAKKPEGADKPEEGKKPGEVGENGEVKKPGEVDENGKPIEEGTETEEGKEPKDGFEESEELKKEKEENDEMREELQGLKDALASLYDMMGSEDEKKEEKAESPGGCCGKPSGAKKTEDGEGNKDWNAILTAGIAAVKAQNLGQPNLTLMNGGQQPGQQGQPKSGGMASLAARGAQGGAKGGAQAAGQNGAAGAKGPQQGGDPRAKLASDYEKAKAAKAELKPEVENEVRNLLGMPPLDGKGQQGQGQQGVGGGQSFPMASGF